MTKIEKLIRRFDSVPSDLTWSELVRVLKHYGYYPVNKKGKTGGSRRRFTNAHGDVIILHEPHPRKTVKPYVIRYIIKHLRISR